MRWSVLAMFLMSCGEDTVVVREIASTCGNGELETGEACDDGNEINTDGCTLACTFCLLLACSPEPRQWSSPSLQLPLSERAVALARRLPRNSRNNIFFPGFSGSLILLGFSSNM